MMKLDVFAWPSYIREHMEQHDVDPARLIGDGSYLTTRIAEPLAGIEHLGDTFMACYTYII